MLRGAVTAGVEEEEGGRALGKLEVGSVRADGRRVHGGVVEVPGVYGGGVGGGGIGVPVVRDFVVVKDVEPGQRRRD